MDAAGLGGPRRPDDGLLEIGQGEWEGLHRDEIGARYRRRPRRLARPPDRGVGPRWRIAGRGRRARPRRPRAILGDLAVGPASERADPVAGYLGARPDGPWSVLVAHDGVFKVRLLTLFDLPLDRFWMWSFDLCGITVVELRAGRAVLRAHNLTEHLAPRQDAAALAERSAREATGAL